MHFSLQIITALRKPMKLSKENIMKQFKNIPYIILYGTIAVLFFFINWILFYYDKNVYYLGSEIGILPNFLLILPIFICIVWLVIFIHNNSKLHRLKLWHLLLAQIVLLMIQLFISYNIYFFTGWDASTIRNTAFQIIEHPELIAENFRHYYSFHVNQTTMAIILGYIMKFFYNLGIQNFYFGTVVVSVLSINLTGLFSTLSVQKITNSTKLSLIYWVLFGLLVGLSPWITIPYSDTYSMLFPSIALFLYVNMPKSILRYMTWFIIAFVSIVGMLIKPQTIIVLLAIIILETYKLVTQIELRKAINFSIIAVIIYATSILSNGIYTKSLELIDFGLIPGRNFTYSHYLMTGFNPVTFGVYYDHDASLSYSTATIEEREAKNWEVILKRIDNYGFVGYLDFSVRKILTNFNDGTFAWGGEGGFYVEIFEQKTFASDFLRDIYYHTGRYVNIFFQFVQFIWLLVLVLIPFGILTKDKTNYSKAVVYITILGIFAFTHLFEARGRYLLTYIPFFIMAAVFALGVIEERLSIYFKKRL